MSTLLEKTTKIEPNAHFIIGSATNLPFKVEFIENVRILLEDGKLREKISSNAKRLVKDFSWEKQGEKLVRMYEDEVEQRKKNALVIIFPGTNIINPKKGDQVRVSNLSIQLGKRDMRIIILESGKELHLNHKKEFMVERFRRFTPSNLNDLNIFLYLKLYKILKKERPSMIQVEGCSGVIASKLVTRFLNQDIPVVYDAHNIEGIKIKKHKAPNLPFYKRLCAPFFIPILERVAVMLADHIISVSYEDKVAFIKRYNENSKKITVIPSGVNIISKNSLKNREKARVKFGIKSEEVIIVFHGTYTYHPNKEAIDLITDYIAPEIKRSDGNVKFIVAGKDVPGLEEKNIKFVGFVENLHSLLNASDIAIAPLLRGGGTKLKIFDYMGAGLPTVTTKKGIAGIKAKNGEHAIIVDDVNEGFIAAINHLIDNEEERKRIGANARKLAEEEYDWDKIGEKLNGLYSNLMEEDKRRKLNDQKYNRIKTKIRRIH